MDDKEMAEAAFEAFLNNLGVVSTYLFPQITDKNDANEFLKNQIKGRKNLSDLEKAVLISETNKIIKQGKRKFDILRKTYNILEQKHTNILSDNSSSVNTDEVDEILDAAKFASEEEIQILWANILAEKIVAPSSVSKSTFRVLSEVTKELAVEFQKICGMTMQCVSLDENREIIEIEPLVVVPYKDPKEIGLSFERFEELETIGLIRIEELGGYGFENSKAGFLYYKGSCIDFLTDKESYYLNIGKVHLTNAGKTLYKFVEKIELNNYFEIFVDSYKEVYPKDISALNVYECSEDMENKISCYLESINASI